MIKVIVTFALIAILVVAIIKKFHTISVFIGISLIGLILWSLITGNSIQGDATTGNLFLDVFQYFCDTLKKTISSNMLVTASILGYVGFMDKIGASVAFTNLLAKPLSKIKQPYILVGVLVAVECFMKLVVPSAISVVALLFGILYPIFVAVGISNITIASAFILGTVITWGPADAGVVLTSQLAGLNVSDFFYDSQFIPCVCEIVVMAIVFVVTSIILDKKQNAAKAVLGEDSLKKQAESMKVEAPAFYAIMPLFPLILIFLFSGRIIPITLEAVTVVLLSTVLADIIHLLVNIKNFKKTLNDVQSSMMSLGDFIGRMGFLMVAGTMFAGLVNKIGGMNIIIEAFTKSGGSPIILVVVGVLLAIIVVACTGQYTANLNIFVPFFVSIAQTANLGVAAMAQVANMACGLGTGLAPASGTLLFITGETSTDFPSVLKRNIVPILSAAATGLVVNFLFYA